MKNLKLAFEKEGVAGRNDSTVREPRERKNRRFRREKHLERMNSDRRHTRIRSTWE